MMVRHQAGTAGVPPSLAANARPTFSRRRLSTQLALGATVLTLGFVLAVGSLSYIVTRRELIHNQDIALENQASLYAQQLGNTLRSLVGTLGMLTQNALILNSLMDSLTRQTALVPFLKDFSRINDVPVTLLLTDFEGQPIAGNSQLLLDTPDWRRQVLETGKPYAAIETGSGGDYLFVAEPIFYSRTLTPEGALLYKIVLAQVQSSLPKPSEGRILLRLAYLKQGVVASSAAIPSGDLQNQDRLAHTELLPVPAVLQPLQLGAEVSIDRSTLTVSLNRLLLTYAAAGTGVMLLVFVLARTGAHYLTRSLRELEVVARSIIESGSLEHRFVSHGAFEVEQLGRVFNQMLEQLGDASRQLYRQAEAEAERNRALAMANAALEQEIGRRECIEVALRESEERFRHLTESSSDWIWEVNAEGRYTFVAGRVKELLGYEPEELIGRTPFDLMPKSEANYVSEQFARIAAAKELIKDLENWNLTKAGQLVCLLTNGVPVLDSQGHLLGYRGIDKDITERKRAEEALRKSEERLTLALSAARAGVWEWNATTNRVIWSDDNYRILGLAPGSVEARYENWLHCVHPDDRTEAEQHVALAMEQGDDLNIEFRVVWPDGGIHWVNNIGKMQFDLAGKPIGMYGIQIDITMRKQAEEALRASEEKYRLLVNHQTDLVVKIDPENRFLFVSPSYCQVFGKTEAELLGKTFMPLVHEEDRESTAKAMEDLFRPPYRDYHEQRALTQVGWRWFGWADTAVLSEDSHVVAIIGVGRDITERKRAEAELAKTVEELRVAEQRQRELLAVTRREQGRLRALLAAMNVGIMFEDSRQHVEYLNPAFRKIWSIDEALNLTGYPRQGVLKHSPHRFARPDYVSRYLLQVLDTDEISQRFELDLADGRTLTQMSYPVLDSEDRLLGRLWLYEDITQERQTAQQLLYLAERDPLTGLYNRHSFQKQLEQKIAAALRTGDQFAVIYFDLDEFKAINDTFGHRAGDLVLMRTAGEITTHVRTAEMFARLGGDEFAILSMLGAGHSPGALPARIVKTISAIPFCFRDTNLRLTASVGIAVFPEHGDNAEDLIARADAAMYQAKNQGKNTWALYDPSRDSTESMMRRLNWNRRIAQALERDLFDLHFQGVYRIEDRVLSHLEVLIRMRNSDDPEHLILPGQFIHLAERSGQVLDIDRWMLRRSVALLGQNADLPAFAVNISGRTFDDPTLPQFIRQLLTEHGVDPQRLFIELTETAAVSDVQDAQRFIEAIQQIGCDVCLDDFGSGFSTFSYLKYLNVKVLKIDGLFVRDLPNNYDNQVFIRAMVEVARGLRKITVAEFVEDAATLDMLRNLGVDLAQGYYLDRPNAEHPALAV